MRQIQDPKSVEMLLQFVSLILNGRPGEKSIEFQVLPITAKSSTREIVSKSFQIEQYFVKKKPFRKMQTLENIQHTCGVKSAILWSVQRAYAW